MVRMPTSFLIRQSQTFAFLFDSISESFRVGFVLRLIVSNTFDRRFRHANNFRIELFFTSVATLSEKTNVNEDTYEVAFGWFTTRVFEYWRFMNRWL